MPARFEALLFVCVIAEALSALAVLVLAFLAPKYIFLAVNSFGGFLALRAGCILAYGVSKGVLFIRMRPVVKREHPVGFWLLIGINLFGLLAGIFLTRLPVG